MGFFDLFLKNRPKPRGKYQGKFEMLNGYEPRFTTWGGSLYESELIRSAINARAVHISKLKFETTGAAKPAFVSISLTSFVVVVFPIVPVIVMNF